MIEVLCVLLGAVLTIVTETIFGIVNGVNKRKHSARLLYYDVLSIIKYTTQYKIGGNNVMPNIRYNDEWQNMLLELDYLTPSQIVIIYNLYDAIYDFNYAFGSEETDAYFNEIEKIVMSNDFSELMNIIKQKAGINKDKN
ncbi:MAG: hypothetical protein ACI4S2_01365 [Lachnospiraceae bacterium]